MTNVVLPKLNQTGPNEFADVADNDEAIKKVVNGELDNGNLAAGAGIVASKLAEEVLKLAVTGTKRVIAFGETSMSLIAGLGAQEVTHGLGKEPVAVLATSTSRDINVGVESKTSTKFVVKVRDFAEPAGGTAYVYWLAIG